MEDKANVSKIVKSTLSVEVAGRIRQMIFNNELKPGERVIETKLAREFGVSQSPIREAIRELEMMGILENVPFRGCVVKELTSKDIVNRYKIRAALEMLAIKDASVMMTDAEYADLNTLLLQMRKSAKKKDKNSFISQDIEFHKRIIQICDNELLAKMWDMVSLGEWTNVTVNISDKGLEELAQRHEKLLGLMKAKDSEGAAAAMKEHIEDIMYETAAKMERKNEGRQ